MDLGFLLQDRLYEMQAQIDFLTQRSNTTMATIQDVQDKIAAEKAQVAEAMDALKAQIQAMQDQLANGIVVTPEQLDALSAAVDGIFTPDAPAPVEPAPAPEVPVEPAPEVPAEPVVEGEPPVEGVVA